MSEQSTNTSSFIEVSFLNLFGIFVSISLTVLFLILGGHTLKYIKSFACKIKTIVTRADDKQLQLQDYNYKADQGKKASKAYNKFEKVFKNEVKKSRSRDYFKIVGAYMAKYNHILYYPFRDRVTDRYDLLKPKATFFNLLLVSSLCIVWMTTILLSSIIQKVYTNMVSVDLLVFILFTIGIALIASLLNMISTHKIYRIYSNSVKQAFQAGQKQKYASAINKLEEYQHDDLDDQELENQSLVQKQTSKKDNFQFENDNENKENANASSQRKLLNDELERSDVIKDQRKLPLTKIQDEEEKEEDSPNNHNKTQSLQNKSKVSENNLLKTEKKSKKPMKDLFDMKYQIADFENLQDDQKYIFIEDKHNEGDISMLQSQALQLENTNSVSTIIVLFILLTCIAIICCYLNYTFSSLLAQRVFYMFASAFLIDLLVFRVLIILVMSLFKLCKAHSQGYKKLKYQDSKGVRNIVNQAVKDMYTHHKAYQTLGQQTQDLDKKTQNEQTKNDVDQYDNDKPKNNNVKLDIERQNTSVKQFPQDEDSKEEEYVEEEGEDNYKGGDDFGGNKLLADEQKDMNNDFVNPYSDIEKQAKEPQLLQVHHQREKPQVSDIQKSQSESEDEQYGNLMQKKQLTNELVDYNLMLLRKIYDAYDFRGDKVLKHFRSDNNNVLRKKYMVPILNPNYSYDKLRQELKSKQLFSNKGEDENLIEGEKIHEGEDLQEVQPIKEEGECQLNKHIPRQPINLLGNPLVKKDEFKVMLPLPAYEQLKYEQQEESIEEDVDEWLKKLKELQELRQKIANGEELTEEEKRRLIELEKEEDEQRHKDIENQQLKTNKTKDDEKQLQKLLKQEEDYRYRRLQELLAKQKLGQLSQTELDELNQLQEWEQNKKNIELQELREKQKKGTLSVEEQKKIQELEEDEEERLRRELEELNMKKTNRTITDEELMRLKELEEWDKQQKLKQLSILKTKLKQGTITEEERKKLIELEEWEYQQKQQRLQELRQKRKNGTITDEELNQLEQLEEQENQKLIKELEELRIKKMKGDLSEEEEQRLNELEEWEAIQQQKELDILKNKQNLTSEEQQRIKELEENINKQKQIQMKNIQMKLANGQNLTKEQQEKLQELEAQKLRELDQSIQNLEDKGDNLTDEEKLKLLGLKQSKLDIEIEQLKRKNPPLSEEDQNRLQELEDERERLELEELLLKQQFGQLSNEDKERLKQLQTKKEMNNISKIEKDEQQENVQENEQEENPFEDQNLMNAKQEEEDVDQENQDQVDELQQSEEQESKLTEKDEFANLPPVQVLSAQNEDKQQEEKEQDELDQEKVKQGELEQEQNKEGELEQQNTKEVKLEQEQNKDEFDQEKAKEDEYDIQKEEDQLQQEENQNQIELEKAKEGEQNIDKDDLEQDKQQKVIRDDKNNEQQKSEQEQNEQNQIDNVDQEDQIKQNEDMNQQKLDQNDQQDQDQVDKQEQEQEQEQELFENKEATGEKQALEQNNDNQDITEQNKAEEEPQIQNKLQQDQLQNENGSNNSPEGADQNQMQQYNVAPTIGLDQKQKEQEDKQKNEDEEAKEGEQQELDQQDKQDKQEKSQNQEEAEKLKQNQEESQDDVQDKEQENDQVQEQKQRQDMDGDQNQDILNNQDKEDAENINENELNKEDHPNQVDNQQELNDNVHNLDANQENDEDKEKNIVEDEDDYNHQNENNNLDEEVDKNQQAQEQFDEDEDEQNIEKQDKDELQEIDKEQNNDQQEQQNEQDGEDIQNMKQQDGQNDDLQNQEQLERTPEANDIDFGHDDIEAGVAPLGANEQLEEEEEESIYSHKTTTILDEEKVSFMHIDNLPNEDNASEDSFSEQDMVYYNKDDLTNYSKGLGLNKVKARQPIDQYYSENDLQQVQESDQYESDGSLERNRRGERGRIRHNGFEIQSNNDALDGRVKVDSWNLNYKKKKRKLKNKKVDDSVKKRMNELQSIYGLDAKSLAGIQKQQLVSQKGDKDKGSPDRNAHNSNRDSELSFRSTQNTIMKNQSSAGKLLNSKASVDGQSNMFSAYGGRSKRWNDIESTLKGKRLDQVQEKNNLNKMSGKQLRGNRMTSTQENWLEEESKSNRSNSSQRKQGKFGNSRIKNPINNFMEEERKSKNNDLDTSSLKRNQQKNMMSNSKLKKGLAKSKKTGMKNHLFKDKEDGYESPVQDHNESDEAVDNQIANFQDRDGSLQNQLYNTRDDNQELNHTESDEGINQDKPNFDGNEFYFKKRQPGEKSSVKKMKNSQRSKQLNRYEDTEAQALSGNKRSNKKLIQDSDDDNQYRNNGLKRSDLESDASGIEMNLHSNKKKQLNKQQSANKPPLSNRGKQNSISKQNRQTDDIELLQNLYGDPYNISGNIHPGVGGHISGYSDASDNELSKSKRQRKSSKNINHTDSEGDSNLKYSRRKGNSQNKKQSSESPDRGFNMNQQQDKNYLVGPRSYHSTMRYRDNTNNQSVNRDQFRVEDVDSENVIGQQKKRKIRRAAQSIDDRESQNKRLLENQNARLKKKQQQAENALFARNQNMEGVEEKQLQKKRKKKQKKDWVKKEINYWLEYDSPYAEYLVARFKEWSPAVKNPTGRANSHSRQGEARVNELQSVYSQKPNNEQLSARHHSSNQLARNDNQNISKNRSSSRKRNQMNNSINKFQVNDEDDLEMGKTDKRELFVEEVEDL